MKKFTLFILLLCLMLTGCGAKSETPPVTSAPELTALPEISPQQIVPLPQNVELGENSSGTLAVSLSEGGVYADGTDEVKMKLNVYAYELYDSAAMSALEAGDSILRLGQNVPVNSIERTENGDIVINGGLDMGGHIFRPAESGDYYEISYNDAKSYTPMAETVFPVSDSFYFVDKSDLDSEPSTYYIDDFFTEGRFGWYFFPSNTSVRVENGLVVSMERIYIP